MISMYFQISTRQMQFISGYRVHKEATIFNLTLRVYADKNNKNRHWPCIYLEIKRLSIMRCTRNLFASVLLKLMYLKTWFNLIH